MQGLGCQQNIVVPSLFSSWVWQSMQLRSVCESLSRCDTVSVLLGDTRLSRLAVFIYSFFLLLIFPRMEQVMSLLSKSLIYLIPVGVWFIGVRVLCGVCLKENQNI